MADSENRTRRQTIQEMLQQAPAAEWVRQMIAYHRRTGTYRSEDVRR